MSIVVAAYTTVESGRRTSTFVSRDPLVRTAWILTLSPTAPGKVRSLTCPGVERVQATTSPNPMSLSHGPTAGRCLWVAPEFPSDDAPDPWTPNPHRTAP